MRTNMYIQAIDKRKAGETTLIQTPDVRSTIQVPRTLKWSEVTFPTHWTIDNENHHLQIQNPVRNPDLDFVQQLADGTVRLSFDQFRYRTPLEYDEPKPRSSVDLYQDPRSRSLLDLRRPFKQPTIFLKDRPLSHGSSSKNLAPRSRRDLGPEFQGVKTHSQVSTPCYTAK